DGHRYPGVTFIAVNVVVSIDTEKRRQYCNDENTYLLGNRSSTQRCDQLTTHNDVDSRPTNACRNIEERHDLGTHPAKGDTGDGHLAQSQLWAKRRKEGNRESTKHVKNDDRKHAIPKSQPKDRVRYSAKHN